MQEEDELAERSLPNDGNRPGGKRRYLPAAERKREILEAAVEEFSIGGFAATSLERIAMRAGISKSGIYAHYGSKEEVFEGMLSMLLLPWEGNHCEALLEGEEAVSLSELLDCYLDRVYAQLSDPRAVAAFRLLMTESGRIPDVVQQWAQRMLERSLFGDRRFLDLCIEKGLIRGDFSNEDYFFGTMPGALWLMQQVLFGAGDGAPVPQARVRALHKRLLMEVLAPVNPAQPS